MRLSVFMFAVLCILASVAAATLGGAQAGEVAGVAWTASGGVAPTAVCQSTSAERGAPTFKPCGKLLNGMAVLCHLDPAILSAANEPFCIDSGRHRTYFSPPRPAEAWFSGLFRPPRPAPSFGNA